MSCDVHDSEEDALMNQRITAGAGLLALAASAITWAQSASPDRIVAEWMLRMGGSVILEGQRRPIRDLAELPTTDFHIHTLNFSGITQWGIALEHELKRLPPVSRVKELYINGRLWYGQPAALVAAAMSLLSGMTQVEKLVLTKPVQTYIPFDDRALKSIST